jgi:hypothetical protein
MKIGSSPASIPNPTPILFFITAAAVLFWPDAFGMTTLIIVGIILTPFIAYWLSQSTAVATTALIVASAVPRLFVPIGGLKARPEHIIGGVMCISILFINKKRLRPANWIWPDYALMVYIGLNIFSSAFASIQPSQTIKWALQQALAILAYFFLRVLVENRAIFRKAFSVLLVIGSVGAIYGILCFYSSVIFNTEFGVTLGQYEDVPATYGLQFEANILGSYSGALCILMLVMYLYEHQRRFLVGYGIALAAMAISLSRAALGATLVATLLVMFFSWKHGRLNKKTGFNLVKAILCAVLVIAPAVLPHYTERFSTVDIEDPTADPNTLTRVVQATGAIDEISKHPILGGGTSSFQLAFDWQSLGTDWEDQGWIGNTEMRVLHDTGVVGLAVFTAFLVSLIRRSRKTLRQQSKPELVALLASGVVYCISFQTTEGTLLAFPWVHLGLIGCAIAGYYAPDKTYGKGLAQTASG